MTTWTCVTIYRKWGGMPDRMQLQLWLNEHVGSNGRDGDWTCRSEKDTTAEGLFHHYYFKDSRKAVMFKLTWAGRS